MTELLTPEERIEGILEAWEDEGKDYVVRFSYKGIAHEIVAQLAKVQRQSDCSELVEECMPTIERFEEVEKQVFYPIPKPMEFSATIRIYASTMAREAVRKALKSKYEVKK